MLHIMKREPMTTQDHRGVQICRNGGYFNILPRHWGGMLLNMGYAGITTDPFEKHPGEPIRGKTAKSSQMRPDSLLGCIFLAECWQASTCRQSEHPMIRAKIAKPISWSISPPGWNAHQAWPASRDSMAGLMPIIASARSYLLSRCWSKISASSAGQLSQPLLAISISSWPARHPE